MKIEVITTPNEKLKETGFGSVTACSAVLNVIENMGHTATLSICETTSDLDKVRDRKPDLVVLCVKYIPTEKDGNIWLSEYFMQQNINFTGSLREVLEFDSNKVLAKTHLQTLGVPTAKYFTAIPGQFNAENELPLRFPLFLKPTDAANGNGIDDLSFVTNFKAFESKILSLYDLFAVPILVEEYLDGREFTVAIIKKTDGELIVSPIEIIPPESTNGLRILGEKVKKEDSEELKSVDIDMIDNVKQLAIDSFTNLGGRDFGRIDIKANKNGKCFFIEANLVPGMTPGSSYFPKSCEIAQGLTYEKVVQLMLNNGINRVRLAESPQTAL